MAPTNPNETTVTVLKRSEKMDKYIPKKSNPTISKPKASTQLQGPKGQQPKVLTLVRKKKITKFLKIVHLMPPQKIGSFGSEQWINCLIEYMKEPKRTSPSVDDVTKWMVDTTFFEDTIKKILKGLPPDLPSPPSSSGASETLSNASDYELGHLLSESSSSSVSNEDNEEEIDESDGMEPTGYSEPVRGKTGWNAIYENHDNLDDETELPKKKLFKCDKEARIILKRCDNSIKKNHQRTIKNIDDGVKQQSLTDSSKPSTSCSIIGDKAIVSIFPAGFQWKTPGRQMAKGQHLV